MYTPFHPVLKLDQKIVLSDIRTNYCVSVDTALPKPWYMCTKLLGITFYTAVTTSEFSLQCFKNKQL